MAVLLLVADEKENFAALDDCLRSSENMEIIRANSLAGGIEAMSNETIDLMVVDETVGGVSGLDIVEKMVTSYPMTNYALVSSLNADDFHEKSEGLGILMQLYPKPDVKQGRQLVERLNKVLALSSLAKE